MTRAASEPHRVVIAGGGVAGLEALVALHTLAGDRVALTLVSPTERFALRADAVAAAFGRTELREHEVAEIAADHDARVRHDALHAVHREQSTVLLQSGTELPYDSVVVAVGGSRHPHPGLHDALTFRGDAADIAVIRGLLAEIDAGHVGRVAFVVPPGTTWTLPLYELAMLTAEHADDVDVTVLTPEGEPVSALGVDASAAIAGSLRDRGIDMRGRAAVHRLDRDQLLDLHGRQLATADRVVALPVLTGPRTRGLPHDADGFLPVDGTGAIRGVSGAYGTGDATTIPYKQGGLAAQQADVVAEHIAHVAGGGAAVTPPRSMLRAHAAAGSGATWFSSPAALTALPSEGVAAHWPLWWPPHKVVMPYLGAYLEHRDR